MHPRPLLVLLAAALLGLGSASAAEACQCGGCPPAACGATAAPGAASLTLRPAGPRGPLVAYDVRSAHAVYSLPPGLASADGRRYVVSLRRPGRTLLHVYDARTGRYRAARHVHGGWNAGGISGNGRWVALVRPAHGATRIRLVDLAGGRGRAFALRGWFDVDAVANDGRRVFLIQYVAAGYLIRFYDLGTRRLAARVLTEDARPMRGVAWGAVASLDGRRLMTLYLRGGSDAEVHTLDLARGSAVCIHLPTGPAAAIRAYSLALAPDGRTLFAANPLLGIVSTIDLPSLRVVRVVHFRAPRRAATAARAAAVSHDGRTVYFAAGRILYAYDTAYRRVRGGYDAGADVAGLAFGAADRTLLVVRRDGWSVRLDAATGVRRG
jgi:SAM-dependent methyltransferase